MNKKVKNILFIFTIAVAIVLASCNKTTQQDSIENTTLLIFGENKLISFNLDSNTVTWSYDASVINGNENKNYLTISDSIVYAPFENGDIMAFNINNGHKRWGYNLKDYASYTNSLTDGISISVSDTDERYLNSLLLTTQPVVIDGKLILSTGTLSTLFSGKVFALNKDNGKVEWIADLPNPYNSFEPISVGKNLYINSSTDIINLDINTGSNHDSNDNPLTNYIFENPIDGQMYYEDNQLFFNDEKGIVYCLDLTKNNNGLEDIFKWKCTLTDEGSARINPKKMIIDKENIYLASLIYTLKKMPDLYFFKINKASGKIEKQNQMFIEPFIDDFIDLDSTILVHNVYNLLLLDKANLNVTTLRAPDNMKVISNLVQPDDNTIIYLTNNGIVKFNLINKEFQLINLPLQFGDRYHFQNKNSLKLLEKSK